MLSLSKEAEQCIELNILHRIFCSAEKMLSLSKEAEQCIELNILHRIFCSVGKNIISEQRGRTVSS